MPNGLEAIFGGGTDPRMARLLEAIQAGQQPFAPYQEPEPFIGPRQSPEFLRLFPVRLHCIHFRLPPFLSLKVR